MSYPACALPFGFSQKRNIPADPLATYTFGAPAVLAQVVIAAVAGDRIHVEAFVNAVSTGDLSAHRFTLFQLETLTVLAVAYAEPDSSGFASGAPGWVFVAPSPGPFTLQLSADCATNLTTGTVGNTAVDSFASLRVTNQGTPLWQPLNSPSLPPSLASPLRAADSFFSCSAAFATCEP